MDIYAELTLPNTIERLCSLFRSKQKIHKEPEMCARTFERANAARAMARHSWPIAIRVAKVNSVRVAETVRETRASSGSS